jgi:hypothetical protein
MQKYEKDADEFKIKRYLECEHIFNKALFDAVNESLVDFKAYGRDGAPMPWSS